MLSIKPLCNLSQHLFLGLFFLFISPNLISATTPTQSQSRLIVEKLNDALLKSARQGREMNLKSRYQELKPIVENVFHFSTMAKITTSHLWSKSEKSLRENLTKELARLTAATYASQFNNYSGEEFKIEGEKPGPQNTTLVKTLIIRPEKKNVKIVYVIKKINEKLGIVDVLLDIGISELAKKRSEYRKILSSNGLRGLINTLRSKTEFILDGNK